MGVLPHLKESVCGLSLEAASKLIGFVVLFFRCLAIILITTSYLVEKTALQKIKDLHQEDMKRMDEKFGGPGFQGQDSIKVFNEDSVFEIIMTIQIVFFVFLAMFDVLMIVGVYKRRASFIFPWVVVQIVAVCFGILRLLNSHAAGQTLASVISIACTCYFILVVNSHHTNLKSQQTSPNTI